MSKKVYCLLGSRCKPIILHNNLVSDCEAIRQSLLEASKTDTALKSQLEGKYIILQRADPDRNFKYTDMEESDEVNDKEEINVLLMEMQKSADENYEMTIDVPVINEDFLDTSINFERTPKSSPDKAPSRDNSADESEAPPRKKANRGTNETVATNEVPQSASPNVVEPSIAIEKNSVLQRMQSKYGGKLRYPVPLPPLPKHLEENLKFIHIHKKWSSYTYFWSVHLESLTNGEPTKSDYSSYARSVIEKYPQFAGGGLNNYGILKDALSSSIRNRRAHLKRKMKTISRFNPGRISPITQGDTASGEKSNPSETPDFSDFSGNSGLYYKYKTGMYMTNSNSDEKYQFSDSSSFDNTTSFDMDNEVENTFETVDMKVYAEPIQKEVSTQTNPNKVSSEASSFHCESGGSDVESNSMSKNDNSPQGFIGYDDIKDKDNAIMKQFCGVSQTLFSTLLNFLPLSIKQQRKHRIVSNENKLLLFLMQMKLGLNYSALGCLLKTSYNSVSNFFHYALDKFAVDTKSWIIWPSREEIKKNMFEDYKGYRAVIDFVELTFYTSPNRYKRVLLHSNQKDYFKIKFLIAISPNGLISFLSKCYDYEATDDYIIHDCGFLNIVESGDIIISMKNSEEMKIPLAERKCKLILPSDFDNPKLSEGIISECSSFDSIKIFIDKIIRKIEEFQILNNLTPILFPHIDKITFIICAFLNRNQMKHPQASDKKTNRNNSNADKSHQEVSD